MKFALVLTFLVVAKGLQLKDGSAMNVEYEFEEKDLSGACITCPDKGTVGCEAKVTILTRLDGDVRQHGEIYKGKRDFDPKKVSKMKYRKIRSKKDMKRSEKIIAVTGNCCWQFYKKCGFFVIFLFTMIFIFLLDLLEKGTEET